MEHAGWLSIAPPVLAIGMAMVTRQVYLSLFAGIWLGWGIIHEGDALTGLADALDACVNVFSDAGNTRVILFSALVGALIAFTQVTGGVKGFVERVTRAGGVSTRRRAMLLSYLIGVVVFVESSITSLVNGSVCRPLFDKMKISREKLAYLCDSTAAPICILIPLNAWGAYIIGLLEKEGFEQPVEVLVESIPYNFYAIAALVVTFLVAWLGFDFGPMKKAEERAAKGQLAREGAQLVVGEELDALQPPEGHEGRALNFILPVLTMVVMMPVGLFITGEGDLMKGSGSTSVFWAVLAGTVVAAVLGMGQRRLNLAQSMNVFFKGTGALVPLAVLMILAFAIGSTIKQLGTGHFVAEVAGDALSGGLLPVVTFLVACFIAFSTGTSWGTFGIMIPIAVPLAAATGSDPTVAIAAALSGGVFGDHCSPISDTTIISSMAAGCDHIDHVNTQLPYASIAGGIAALAFLLVGVL